MKSSFPKTKFPFLACSGDFLFRIDGGSYCSSIVCFFFFLQSVAIVAILNGDDGDVL